MYGRRKQRRHDSLAEACLFLVLLLSACHGTSSEDPGNLYERASANLTRGNLQIAHEEAKRGLDRFSEQRSPVWHWKFRILEADILRSQAKYKDALDLLDSPLPSSLETSRLEPELKLVRAQTLVAMRRLQDAASLLDEAERLASAHGPASVLGPIQNLRAQILFESGKLDEAEIAFRSALRLARAQDDFSTQAKILNNLGFMRMTKNRFDEAVRWYDQALTAAARADAKLVASRANTNLVICLYRLGELDQAQQLVEKAIEQQEKEGAIAFLQGSLGEAGNVYWLRHEPEKAASYYARALDLARQTQDLRNASIWAANLSRALMETQKWDEAEKLNNESLEIRRQLKDEQAEIHSRLDAARIAKGRTRYPEARALFEDVIDSTAAGSSLRWEAHQGLAESYWLTGNRVRALQHFREAVRLIEASATALTQRDYRIPFLACWRCVYQEYVDALLDSGDYQKALEVAESSRARSLLEHLGLETPQRNTSFNAYVQTARVNDAVLLSYWLGENRSYVWVLSPQGTGVFQLPASGEIARLVKLQESQIQNLRDLLADAEGPSQQLYNILVQPVAHLIPKQGAKVIVVPDGPLHALNFETLIVPDKLHYWIEDVTVSVTPSLDVLTTKHSTAPDHRSALLIGDADNGTPEFPKLPYAAREIEVIDSRLAGYHKEIFTGPAAIPAVYTDRELMKYSIIHFAAHAWANSESPLDSAVILSRKSETDDSFRLYARQVLERPLNAELVTISACRSAGAKAYAGEGLVGFSWAFLRVGARNVVAGLWNVGDNSAAALMDELYSGIAQTLSPSVALRRAKLNLVRSTNNYRKPYYWAPFLIYTREAG
jgi:CHAT domain-containing protein